MLIIGGLLNMIIPLYFVKREIDKGVKFKEVVSINRYCDWFKFGFALTAVGLGLWLWGL